MPLARAGWLLLAASIAASVVGRLFGILELTVLAVAGAVLCLVAAAAVTLSAPNLEVRRVLSGGRAHAGGSLTVTLTVVNRGRRRSPVVELADRVGRRAARLLVGPLRPGEEASSMYSLPTPARGRLRVGPLELHASDPFGLARASRVAAGATEVVVLPRVVAVRPLPRIPTDDPSTADGGSRQLTSGAGEFHALRPYEIGDDLRRVHWSSSLRLDELVVRQNEQPWDAVVTIVLDTRAGAFSPGAFEDAVVAAASIAAASHRARARLRLVTAGGFDSGLASGPAQLDRVLRHLATVQAVDDTGLAGLLAAHARRSAGAAVFVVGRLGPTDQAAARHAAARVPVGVVVTADPATAPRAPRLAIVAAGPGFGRAWDTAMTRAHHRSPAA